jgi:hypothetical protein
MINDTLTVVDNRTGKSYELPIEHGAIRSTDLRQIRTGPDDFGLLAYDPAFMNTAACKSRITRHSYPSRQPGARPSIWGSSAPVRRVDETVPDSELREKR